MRQVDPAEDPRRARTAVLRAGRGHGQAVTGRTERSLRFLRENLQLVFQDPMRLAGPADAGTRYRRRAARGATARRDHACRVAELLSAVGLDPDVADRYPHPVLRRSAPAHLDRPRPRPQPGILLADEPVSALDVSVRAQVLNVLSDLVDTPCPSPWSSVSHDLGVVRHVCGRVAVMKGGEIVETGPTAQVYDAPTHPYAQAPSQPSRRSARRSAASGPPTSPRASAGPGTRPPGRRKVGAMATPTPGPTNSLTDVDGIRVGHAQRVGDGWLTGTTVVLAPRTERSAGRRPRRRTRNAQTDLQSTRATSSSGSTRSSLSGGSAFGLAAADGVMGRLARDGWVSRWAVPATSSPSSPAR